MVILPHLTLAAPSQVALPRALPPHPLIEAGSVPASDPL